MTYLNLHVSFLRHQKVLRLAKALEVCRPTARGLMATLWLNMLVDRPDGVLNGWDAELVALYSEWDGNHDTYLAALERLNILDRLPDGTLCVHNWENQHCGTDLLAKRREKDRIRQQNRRDRLKAEAAAKTASSRDGTVTSREITHERRGEDLKKEAAAAPAALTLCKPTEILAPQQKTPPPPPRTPRTPSTSLVARSGELAKPGDVTTAQDWELYVANTLHVRQLTAKYLPLLRTLLPLTADELHCGWQQTQEMGGKPSAAMLLRKIEIMRREPEAQPLPAGVNGQHATMSFKDRAALKSTLASRQIELER